MENQDKRTLLIPGPVPYSKDLFPQEAVGHTDPGFREKLSALQEGLREVFGVSGFTAALTGSGSWGAEVAALNFLGPSSRVVVLSAGLFGDRLAEMASLRGAQVHVVRTDEEGRVPFGLLAEAVRAVKPDLFAVVHVDTSTGIMVPLDDVLEMVRAASPYTLTVVDAVASAGAMPLKLDGLADYVFTASQKGLEALAGLAPIAVSARGMAHVRPASWYGDLKRIWAFWEKGEYHHTPAVPLIEALQKAVDMALADGLAEREGWSRVAYAFMREALGDRFIFPYESVAAPTVAVLYPKEEDPGAILLRLKEAGVVVAPGIGPTRGRAIRVGLFGRQALKVKVLVEALLDVLV
jgi:alanine-glyoxylate transaminase/serine-glyoxylate transaminase/serine-pyruvate transaminase